MPFLKKQNTSGYKIYIDTVSHVLFLVATVLLPLFYLPCTRDVIALPKQFFLYGVVLVGLFFWLLKIVLLKELYIRRTILDIPLIVFALLSLVSVAFSISPSLSFLGRINDFVLHFGGMLSYMIWYWLFVQLVDRSDIWRWFLYSLLLSGILASLLFLFRETTFFQSIFAIVENNTVSKNNSVFAVFVALIAVVGVGLAMIRERSVLSRVLPVVAAVVGIFTLIRLGFLLPWVIFAVGIGCLLVMGFTMLAQTSKVALIGVFVIFVFSLVAIFVGLPNSWKTKLPVEVALGVHASYDITTSAAFDSTKSFFVGTGPGTFIYNFSQYRPEVFNTNSLASGIRFTQAYSTFLAMFSEFGILAFLGFIFVIIFSLGSMLAGWMKSRPSVWQRVAEVARNKISSSDDEHPIRLEVFVITAAWIAATVGLGVVYYDVALWWLWWWLLAAGITGLSALIPDFIKGKKILLQVSPQYSLALSFSMVLAFILIVMAATFGGRLYFAEVAYTKATTMGNLEASEEYINKAITYRPNYVSYRLAAARHYLQRAREASEKENINSDEVARYLAQAVNEARFAADEQPDDVQTWETLAAMYVNARAFVPDANKWAEDALGHIVELEPSNARAFWQLAGIYIFAERVEDAEDAFRKAILLKPDYIAAYVGLSQLFESQENIDEAISVFEPVSELVNQSFEVMYHLGRLFFNRNEGEDVEKAKVAWERAVELNPNYSNALYSLGILHEKRGEIDKALVYYKKVRELNPGNEEVGERIGVLGG